MTAAQILVIVAAGLLANLPFLIQRSLFGWPRYNGAKPLHFALLELLLMYFFIGIAAYIFEGNAYGAVYPQSWEFYAVTLALFVVFAYPGFVYRYIWSRRA